MKKEDFIVGKWYVSNSWTDIQAAKFERFQSNMFKPSEYIKYNNHGFARHIDSYYDSIFNYREISISEISKYLPKDHPDLGIINIENELQEFPEQGFCRFNKLDDWKLYCYLSRKFPESSVKINACDIGLAWNKLSFWNISIGSGKKEYKIEQLNKFINNNTKENVKQNSNNEVQSITSENRQSSRTGAIAIRCGRQQITVGNRPNGNTTRSKIGRTEIKSVKICKTIIKSENY